MEMYKKPIIVSYEELAEGIYAASGNVVGGDAENNEDKKGCQSKYMNGEFKVGNWSYGDTYKNRYGCLNCPANWGSCAVDSPNFNNPNPAMPGWEAEGHKGDEISTD